VERSIYEMVRYIWPSILNFKNRGLKDTMKVFSFRYNLKFNEMKPDDFFVDLANSGIFGRVVTQAAIPSEMVTKVGFEKLKTNFTDLNFLNVLEERRKLIFEWGVYFLGRCYLWEGWKDLVDV
jgi:hypothetical protein